MNIHLDLAIKHLHGSGVIAYPTEAVWGLGCDPYNAQAVFKLLSLKQRPVEKGLILIASNIAQVEFLLEGLTPDQRALCESTWPGPNTWILPDSNNLVPLWVKGSHSSVAVRVSKHPLVVKLCDAWGGLLVSTSANLTNQQPAKNIWSVKKRFRQAIYVLPGELGGLRKPSVIRSAVTGDYVRQ